MSNVLDQTLSDIGFFEDDKKKISGGSNRITKTEAQQSMLNRKQKKLSIKCSRQDML